MLRALRRVTLLFGVSATDVRTLVLTAAVVLAVGVLASYLPARRAATLDPCHIFREE
jgi:ABC-type antimicrobial peptide transport system permease subunit